MALQSVLNPGLVLLLKESGQRLTPEEVDRVEMMPKFTLNNAHYFCETADITRPFPSSHSVDDPSWEFVWNRWLAAFLRNVGLLSHCPHLLQARHFGPFHATAKGHPYHTSLELFRMDVSAHLDCV